MLRFRDGKIMIMFSSIAFGLGIDIPDVRTVIVVFRSSTLQEFWQLANRAGRDGRRATVIYLSGFPSSNGCCLGRLLCFTGVTETKIIIRKITTVM